MREREFKSKTTGIHFRAHIVFKEGINVHLKLVGKLTDQCHDTLFQFGGFLSTNLNQEEYTKQVPKIETLIEQYGTPWDVAFFISRQMYNHQIIHHYDGKFRRKIRKIDIFFKKKSCLKMIVFSKNIRRQNHRCGTKEGTIH